MLSSPQTEKASSMTFEQVISAVVLVIEGFGAAILVVGGAVAFLVAIPKALRADTRAVAYQDLRRNLGQAILLGLEVLIVADIIRTILVTQTVESVLILATIVLIRILLSFSLEVEIDGAWPWNRWRLASGQGRSSAQSPE